MRYPEHHTDEVRQQLLQQGGRHVKQRGMAAAGVDGIARRAGLSGPALYKHFDSKQDYLGCLLSEELSATAERFLASQTDLRTALSRYLSLDHARHPEAGCALPALVADVARSSEPVQSAFDAGLREIAASLEARLDDPDQAFGLLAAAVGGVALARALPDDARAQQVLDSTRELLLRALAPRDP